MNLNQFKKALTRPEDPWKDEEHFFWDFLQNSGSMIKGEVYSIQYFELAAKEILDWPPGKLEELYAQWNIERGEEK